MEGPLFLARLLVGAVFVMSAVPKLAAPRTFVQDVERYRVGPTPAARVYGWLLPYGELAAGLGLLAGWPVAWAAGAVLVMLASFMIAVGVAMARKQNLTCSCFGLLYRERVGWGTEARDAFLVAMTVAVLLNADLAVPVWDLVTNGVVSDYLSVLFTMGAALVSLLLGFVSVRGWPGSHPATLLARHELPR